jgi:signal peptidase I
MKYSLPNFHQLRNNLKPNTKINIISESMEPWIKSGETIFVSPVKLNDLESYDNIVYWEKERQVLVCHIFLTVRDGHIICRPLSTKSEDLPINPNFLFGRVVFPKFRWYHRLLLKIIY